MKKQYIIPIFVPHLGCPNDCIFCNQKSISGQKKNITKEDAKKIIDDFAILEIKVLLQSTGLTIQEIADRLGFPDQSYLGRYFKRHEGMSPKEYQSKYSI